MGAEMDCCDSTDEGRRFYVELKTSREVDIHIHSMQFGVHLLLFNYIFSKSCIIFADK
jgi:RAT1-interacting protein